MTEPQPGSMARLRRHLLFVAGWLSFLLALLGMALPLLPTVPLLLLAAACFARSSPRFHGWLLDHRKFGPLIQTWQTGGGIPRRAKLTAIAMLWVSILFSAFVLVPIPWVKGLLLGIATAVTVYLLRLPTLEPFGNENDDLD